MAWTPSFASDAIAILAALLVVWWLYKAVNRPRAIRQVPDAPHSWPFGIDLLIRILHHFRKHTFFDYFREVCRGTPGLTVELNMLGVRLVLTEEPENIKAILATDFEHYEKGEPLVSILYCSACVVPGTGITPRPTGIIYRVSYRENTS